jgi:hypothetical protein
MNAVSQTIKELAQNLHSVVTLCTASNALPPLELLRPLAKLDTQLMLTLTLGSASQMEHAPKNLAHKNRPIHNNKDVAATPRYAQPQPPETSVSCNQDVSLMPPFAKEPTPSQSVMMPQTFAQDAPAPLTTQQDK